jgi:hypothetical protein
MAASSGKVLLVEGRDDLFAIARLMAHHVPWGEKEEEWPVKIEACHGVDTLLKPGFLSTRLKARGPHTVGVIIDADDQFASRWTRLRSLCIDLFPGLPPEMPTEGLVADNEDGNRLGAWIMPDNMSRGMLETFLGFLVPTHEEPVWQRARTAVEQARADGAKCRDHHIDKSNIYTWMAWQDPPGQSMGTALLQRAFDSQAPYAAPFVDWFRKLFQI